MTATVGGVKLSSVRAPAETGLKTGLGLSQEWDGFPPVHSAPWCFRARFSAEGGCIMNGIRTDLAGNGVPGQIVGIDLTFDGRARSARPTLHDHRTGWAGHSVRGHPWFRTPVRVQPMTLKVPSGGPSSNALRAKMPPGPGRPVLRAPSERRSAPYWVTLRLCALHVSA